MQKLYLGPEKALKRNEIFFIYYQKSVTAKSAFLYNNMNLKNTWNYNLSSHLP